MKYRTICADPPWPYTEPWPGAMSQLKPGSRATVRIPGLDGPRLPYPSLTVAEIAELPVASLAEPSGCHLYLWTTNRYLPHAFGIVQSWGFRYSQLLVWAKTPKGLGPGGTFANSTEYVLFARRGTLRHIRRMDSTWFNWPRTDVHSRKPEHFLDMVEQVSPGPYVELFARRHRLGWDVHGFESANTATLETTA